LGYIVISLAALKELAAVCLGNPAPVPKLTGTSAWLDKKNGTGACLD
jgi:hypothetical protein